MFAFSKEAQIGLTFATMIKGTLKNGIKFEARSQSQISRRTDFNFDAAETLFIVSEAPNQFFFKTMHFLTRPGQLEVSARELPGQTFLVLAEAIAITTREVPLGNVPFCANFK